MKKILLALVIFISFSNLAFASDWTYLGIFEGGNRVYLDKDSIVKSYDKAEGWTKYILPDGSKILCRFSAREKDRTIAVSSYVLYDAEGKVLDQQTFPKLVYMPFLPDSIGEAVYNSFYRQ